jgi:tetratricopeptide (TPR) repeat protein
VHAQPAFLTCFSETTIMPEERISACDEVVRTNPPIGQLAHAYFMRAQAYSEMRQDNFAVADLARVLMLLPDNLSALANRAVAYGKLHDYDHALADDDRLIRLNPGVAVGYVNRGVVLADKGNNARAVADFNHALAIDPRLSGGILSNRGRSYVELGNFSHAIADEDASIKLHGNNADAFSNRCYARAAANFELDQAKADCNRALSIRPGDLNALEKRGLVFLQQHNFLDARRDFDAALAIEPNRAFSLYGRGLAKIGLKENAGESDLREAGTSDSKIRARFAAMGLLRSSLN